MPAESPRPYEELAAENVALKAELGEVRAVLAQALVQIAEHSVRLRHKQLYSKCAHLTMPAIGRRLCLIGPVRAEVIIRPQQPGQGYRDPYAAPPTHRSHIRDYFARIITSANGVQQAATRWFSVTGAVGAESGATRP